MCYYISMAKIDEVKEQIGLLKFWLGIAVAVLLAIGGWIANHYTKAEWFIILAAVVVVLLCVVLGVIISTKINHKIKELKEL